MRTKIKRSVGRPSLPIPVIDWNKPNTIIAKEKNTSVMTVIKWRKALGIKPLERGRPIITVKYV